MNGSHHRRPRAGWRYHYRNSCEARCNSRRQTAAALPEAQSAETAASLSPRCRSCPGTPAEAGSMAAGRCRSMNPDCRNPSSRGCSAARVGRAAPAGSRPARRTGSIRHPAPRPGAAAAELYSAHPPLGPLLERPPSNGSRRQRQTAPSHVAAARTEPALPDWPADARRTACWNSIAEHSSPRAPRTAGWRSKA